MKELTILFLEWLLSLIVSWLRKLSPPPPVEVRLPLYVKDIRRAHPTLTDEELKEAYWAKCQELTWFYAPTGERNDEEWMILDPARPKDDHEIHAGQEVLVYRWAFPVNGGTVREVFYHVEGQKMLVDIKKFSKPGA